MATTSKSPLKDNNGDGNGVEERIVLNVGGVKYEAYRSTFTAYPQTRLGKLFRNKKKTLANLDEHFFDRNGRTFHYILEYYRTGLIHIPREVNGTPTNHEVFRELEYFEIIPSTMSYQDKAVTVRIDQIILFLRNIYFEMASDLTMVTNIRFHQDGTYYASLDVDRLIGACGYPILEKFGKDIESYFKSTFPQLETTFTHYPKGFTYPENDPVPIPHYFIRFSLSKDAYNLNAVRDNSSLKSRDP
ncbi:2002_t:CDS:2 [Ambispora leptoticha]|uniref:2002_t:CDS:1 n=1 Tax=Ambispora leptoticha TaxID=144679 RepID=A0A9N9HXV4_9GLOM|nr:2002_t:CDS:2 [Ambispora leptoticha]